MLHPIDTKKEKVTRTLCELRYQKVKSEGGYTGTYKSSFKEVWDNNMDERQKRNYSFEQIYDYMINS